MNIRFLTRPVGSALCWAGWLLAKPGEALGNLGIRISNIHCDCGLCRRRRMLAEMTRLDEEMGLYDTVEKVPPAIAMETAKPPRHEVGSASKGDSAGRNGIAQ